MQLRSLLLALVTATVALSAPSISSAAETNVAVAANFTEAVKEIAAAFEKKTGHTAVLSFGASGALLNQISQGAPFQVFLSADSERPRQALDKGLAVPGTSFTYAVGKLVLWSKSTGVVTGEDTLKADTFNKLSIADPKSAPYGAAAVETLKALKLYDTLQPKIVQGSSIAQAFQFIDTGNAEVGFIALSQLYGNEGGSRWIVPQDLYAPIKQDAVLLKTGERSEAAKAFLEFLKGPEAAAVIKRYGYDTGA